MSRIAGMSLWALTILAVAAPCAARAQDDAASWQHSLGAWRTLYERDLSAPDGWLTLVGLEWLKTGVNSFGSAADNTIHLSTQAPAYAGILTVSGKDPDTMVQLLSPQGGFPAGMSIDGHPAREGTLKVSDTTPSTITWNGLSMVVLRRGDRYVLRIKDADSPTRTAFHGLSWYAPDQSYVVNARWIPFKPRRVEQIPTVIGTMLNMTAPGVVEFLLKGKVYLLEPVLEGGENGKLFFILGDETSKTTTYQGGRFLNAGLPDHGLDEPGNITIDFNRLYNPPCAYTPYATCPLPPQQNRLPVAIEAGEQRYAPAVKSE